MSAAKAPPAVDLAALGWDHAWAEQAAALASDAVPARVAIVYQDRLAVRGAAGQFWAELRGRLRRRQSDDALAIPAAGDWVLVADNPGGGMATVEALLPRRTRLVRQAAGRRTVPQVVAANIDTVFVVTTPNRDFNPRRVERYLAAIADGGAAAAVILNKVDLTEDPAQWIADLEGVARGAPILPLSAATGGGLEALDAHLGPGRTVAFVGSSGVGKSSLINRLLGDARQAVAAIREEDDKGRHTTTHRELVPLAGGRGIVIDTPGMRELQLWSEGTAVRESFEDVEAIARGCRFRDCQHRREPGCAVRAAVRAGRLPPARLAGFHKLASEASTHELQRADSSRIAARRRGRLARDVRDEAWD
ncbi:MAG: ribosome small subunit-dependent GTPase A [Nannocystaceae bacterium]